MKVQTIHYAALAGALVLNATANLMMKFGMERFKAAVGALGPAPGLSAKLGTLPGNWILVLGLCCFALNVALYAFALKELPISVAYPIMVTVGFAIIVIVAGIYLHERLGTLQWLGVVLILSGVWLVGSGAQRQLAADRPQAAASPPNPAG